MISKKKPMISNETIRCVRICKHQTTVDDTGYGNRMCGQHQNRLTTKSRQKQGLGNQKDILGGKAFRSSRFRAAVANRCRDAVAAALVLERRRYTDYRKNTRVEKASFSPTTSPTKNREDLSTPIYIFPCGSGWNMRRVVLSQESTTKRGQYHRGCRVTAVDREETRNTFPSVLCAFCTRPQTRQQFTFPGPSIWPRLLRKHSP